MEQIEQTSKVYKVYLICKGTKEKYEVLQVLEVQDEAELYGVILSKKDKCNNIFIEEHSIIKAGIINEMIMKILSENLIKE